MTSISFFKYFDAFELDVIVVNFAYYGKTWIVVYSTIYFEASINNQYNWLHNYILY